MENIPDYVDYKDCLVAFVDILGFDKRTREISNSDEFFEVGKLLYVTKATSDNISALDGLLKDFEITAISDSIIVSVPFADPLCTVGMLNILHNIQYELVGTGYNTLLRGYIARGPTYHKNGLIFGSGYSDAFKGESIIGGAPRIVLDPDVVKDAKRVIESLGNKVGGTTALDLLKEDVSDGFHFIDYLKPVGSQMDIPKKQLIHERNLIRKFIQDSLHKYDGVHSIIAKYKWLNNYFNETEMYY